MTSLIGWGCGAVAVAAAAGLIRAALWLWTADCCGPDGHQP